MDKINTALNDFLKKGTTTKVTEDGMEEEICNMETGECYVIRAKDGLVERLNKRYVIEDGRQLLQD